MAFGTGAANDGSASDDDAFPMGAEAPAGGGKPAAGPAPAEAASGAARRARRLRAGGITFAVAAVALALCFGLGLGPVPAVIVVLLAWVATAMSAQSVGQTGIDPMEIFGLIVLLAVAAVADVPQVQLFFVAGVVAVACGLAGDVMNDFHAGHVLGTSPRAQWIGQAIGGVLGALVAVAVMAVLVSARTGRRRSGRRRSSCPRRHRWWRPWCPASRRCRRSRWAWPQGLRSVLQASPP